MNNKIDVIAFDLHGVIFRLDWKEIFRIWWRHPHKFKFFFCGFNVRLIWNGLKLMVDSPTDEEAYALFERFCPSILPLILEWTNAQKPIEGSLPILQELKDKGYKLHVVSNTGPRRLKVLKERFASIVNLFDCSYYANGGINHMIKKPEPRFFSAYLEHCGATANEVLFVDDNKHNIKAAQQAGFQTIRFKNSKQLCAELRDRGIGSF